MDQTTGFEPAQDGSDDPLDVAAFGKLRALIGDDKAALLLSKMIGQLETVITETAVASCDRTALSRTAHAAVSSAGALGFRRFARLCAGLEAACATDRDLSDLTPHVIVERRRIAARVAQLAVELGAPTAGRAS